jgi:hypothetical protein
MLVKKIRTKTRPNTSIPWTWTTDENNEIILEETEFENSCLNSGLIHSINSTISEDELTHTKEYNYTSIDNMIEQEKQDVNLNSNAANKKNYLQHFADNNITWTTSYSIEN